MLHCVLHQMEDHLPADWRERIRPELARAHRQLQQRTGVGSDYTGWISLPEQEDETDLLRILDAARRIRRTSQALVVVGIGGSYLGTRGVIECIHSPAYNLRKKDTPNIYYVGNSLSADGVQEVLELLEGTDYSVNVVSKSGSTLEPAVIFRLFRQALEQRYGKEGARSRIYATTDRARGPLKTLADREGWETFTIPDDVGGRYSVLSPVGLLPAAVCGVDIRALLAGAREMMVLCQKDGWDNPAWDYAGVRQALYRAGKKIEILGSYEPSFQSMTEWWRQLFAESEGKDGKGLFPTGIELTSALHSIGQYIQQGERTMFETIVFFRHSRHPLTVPDDPENSDGLNYLAGQSLDHLRTSAMEGAMLAHHDGGVPNIRIELDGRTERCLGQLIYFFEYACALSCYLLGVNPFDQPGVEAYKRNMFALLGRPGYESVAAALESDRDFQEGL